MIKDLKPLTGFLVNLGVEEVAHTHTTYLAHLVGVYRYMRARGCEEEVCRAGMFHSIYGTELFQGFKLPLERRPEVRELIGERAERLAYWNCAMDRASLDRALQAGEEPYRIVDRLTDEDVRLPRQDFDDLCRVHLYDWLEQVPRSKRWNYRPEAYRRMAERLGGAAKEAYERTVPEEAAGARSGD